MENKNSHINSETNFVSEPNDAYQKNDGNDTHQLEEALQRTDMERFEFLMKLVKTQRMMQKMSITHQL